MNSSIIMPFIRHFKVILFCFFCFTSAFATTDSMDDLDKRLSIYPPSPQDYIPIIETIGGQLESIRQKGIERAYFFYTSKDFRQQTSLPNFQLFVRENKVLSDNKALTLVEVHIDKNIGYYKGIISSNDGQTRTINYELIYENETWKILGMQLK